MSELTPKHAIVPSAKSIAEALSCGRSGCPCQKVAQTGKGLTHCLAHADNSPSLSVSEKQGKLLVRCFGGCSQESVISALREKGLWSNTPT